MKISIDHRTCIGSGQCTLTAPTVFTQDDDGYAALVSDGARTATLRQVTQAALSCPVQAIAVKDGLPEA
ncbi:ferredoxin [Streptomyces longwoodensis]|uniref:ferredoxin n=1 Tax=Streptomyces longwoodensis TaxID=68231 RepID=UPI0033BE3EFC